MPFLIFCFLLLFTCPSFAQVPIGDLMKLSYRQLDSISYIPKAKGEYAKAIPYIEASRAKAKAEYGTQDTIYALYTNELGVFWEMIGQYPLAETLLLEAQGIFEKVQGKEHNSYAHNLNCLGELYLSMKRLDLAESFFLEAKEIYAKIVGKENQYYATVLNNLAVLYKEMGNFSQAELLDIETKNIRAKTLGKEHPHYANSLNNLALMYKILGRFAEAEPLYLEAKEIKEKTLGKNHPQYAQGLSNLALLYYEMEKYEQVEPLLLEASAIQAKVLGLEHPIYALSLNNLAGMYQELKQYTKSEKLYLQAKAIRDKVYGKGHPNCTSILNSLGMLYSDMGKDDLAWEYMRQTLVSASGLNISININEAWKDSLLQVRYPSFPYIDKMVRALRSTYGLLGKDSLNPKKEQQRIVADLVNELLKKSKDGIANEQDKLRLLSQSYLWMLHSLKVMDFEKDVDKIFEIMELNKAGLLLEATKAEQIYQLGGLPDSLIEEEKILLKKQATLEAGLLENRPEQEKQNLLSELNGISQEIIFFKKKVEKKYPQYASLKYKQTDIEIKDVQELLSPNAALLEYVIGDSTVYIFYVDKTRVKVLQQKISQKELNQRIKELQDALCNYTLLNQKEDKAYRLYVNQAYWFYQNLIEPVLDSKVIINQLIIVSDGVLGHLPFETFLVEQAPQTLSDYAQLHYLVKDYKISYNYSATLWKTCKEAVKHSNNGSLFAMAANYNIQLDSNQQKLRLPAYLRLRKHLNPLPAAQKEVETLSQEFSGFFGFDKNASEKIFKEKAGDYAVIHLAMHGILDKKAPILSSLAFTEDGDSVENNFLQAYEISKMNLNADLVVLSACETGYGKFEKGNGITSLAQAFAYSGASALVVSLWQVSDAATSEIMKNFYHNLADGMEKDEALRQAKLEYMKVAKGIAAHPAFWSPFIMMGNTDAITLGRTHVFAPTWVICIGLIILGSIAFVIKRKKEK